MHPTQPPAHTPAPSLLPPREQLSFEPSCSPSRGRFPTWAPKVAVARGEKVQSCCGQGGIQGHRVSPHCMGACRAAADRMRLEMPHHSQGLCVGGGVCMHPCFHVQSKPQSTGTKCLLSPALMVTPVVLPSIPLHNWVSPHHPHHLPSREMGKPDPGEKQSLSPDSATVPFAPTGSAHPKGFLPTPAGRHPHRGLLPMVERSRAQPLGQGAPEGAWLETAATRALAGSRVLPACLQSLPGKLYPPALLHPVSWVEKRKPPPPTPAHTPCHVNCSGTSSPRAPSPGAIRKFLFATVASKTYHQASLRVTRCRDAWWHPHGLVGMGGVSRGWWGTSWAEVSSGEPKSFGSVWAVGSRGLGRSGITGRLHQPGLSHCCPLTAR